MLGEGSVEAVDASRPLIRESGLATDAAVDVSAEAGCCDRILAAVCALLLLTVSIGGGFFDRNQSLHDRPPLSGEPILTLADNDDADVLLLDDSGC